MSWAIWASIQPLSVFPPNMVKNLSSLGTLKLHDFCDPSKPPPSHALPLNKKKYTVTRLPPISAIPKEAVVKTDGDLLETEMVNIIN